MRRFLVTLLAVVALGVVKAQEQTSPSVQFQKLVRVCQYLSRIYVDEVDMEPLTEAAIRAMLEELDPHSAYIDRETMSGVKEEFDGEYSGIGIEFGILRDTLHVVNCIAGGPAERVGVLPNDRIVRIDTTSAVGIKQHAVPKLLRGKRGSKVEIAVSRVGEQDLLHFVLTRDRIPLNTVDCAYMASQTAGYIKINRFGRTTYEEFLAAYHRLNAPQELILDLRGNGGGLLDQAIRIAGFFLPKNTVVVSTEGRAIPSSSFRTQCEGANRKGRLVVLIDENSASASEIVSGAIQDWDRGVIVGAPSFGKGLVQRQIELGDGSAVRITMARYHTPSGRVIQRPYEKGKRKEYYMNHLSRTDAADTLDTSLPLYHTLVNHRPVYGGGGIRPDVRIASDTSGYTKFFGELMRRGVLNEFVVELIDRDRERVEREYPGVEDFVERFAVDDALLDALCCFAEGRKVKTDPEELAASRKWIATRIRALVAQRIYGVEGFYRVMNHDDDRYFKEAFDLFRNWTDRAEKLLQGR